MSVKSEDVAKLLASVVIIVLSPLMYFYFVGSYGLAISLLWGWLILPSFPGLGLPALTLAQGVAVAAFSRVFRRPTNCGEKKDGKADLVAWVSPWLAIVFGWFLSIVLF